MKRKIFILHGWAHSTEKWKPLVDELDSKGVTAVVLKVPGLTASLKEVWTLDNYVEWLRKELREEKEKAILLGHSNGGRINLAFTARYPEKVEQLILIDSAGIYTNALPIRIKRFVFGNIARIGRKFTNSEVLRKLLYKVTRESDYERADPILRKTMHNLISTDISHLFSTVDVPVTIIWGERDAITPLKDGKIMQEKLRHAKLHIILGARHSPMFTNVKEVAEIIGEVLGSK